MYEPLWLALKKSKTISITVQHNKEYVESPDFNPASDDAKNKMLAKFKRVRKALSNRKCADVSYTDKHPHARIEKTKADPVLGKITFELRLEAVPFSLTAIDDLTSGIEDIKEFKI